MDEEIEEILKNMSSGLDLLEKVMNERFEKLKEVIGDYLELSSSISLASVKTSLKNV